MVPCGTHTRGGEQGIVEHRVGVIEAPVGDTDQHILAGICLWQVDAPVHTIGPNGLDQPVQIGFHLAGEFDVGDPGQSIQRIELLGVDAEGHHITDPRTDLHRSRNHTLQDRTWCQPAQKTDHATTVHVSGRMAAFSKPHKLLGIGVPGRQRTDLGQSHPGGGRHVDLGHQQQVVLLEQANKVLEVLAA